MSLCPVQPLDSWIAVAMAPTAFFSLWRGPTERTWDPGCQTDHINHGVQTVNIPNYFLAVREPGNELVRVWLNAFFTRLVLTIGIDDWYEPGHSAPYFLADCTVAQLLEANQTLMAVVTQMPHYSPWLLEGNSAPGSAVEPVWDVHVDSKKVMYKEKGHHNITDPVYHAWVVTRGSLL